MHRYNIERKIGGQTKTGCKHPEDTTNICQNTKKKIIKNRFLIIWLRGGVGFRPGGMIVLYLCAQLAVLYTYLFPNIDIL